MLLLIQLLYYSALWVGFVPFWHSGSFLCILVVGYYCLHPFQRLVTCLSKCPCRQHFQRTKRGEGNILDPLWIFQVGNSPATLVKSNKIWHSHLNENPRGQFPKKLQVSVSTSWKALLGVILKMGQSGRRHRHGNRLGTGTPTTCRPTIYWQPHQSFYCPALSHCWILSRDRRCEVSSKPQSSNMSALFGIAENFSDQVKKLFNPSKIQTGNFIFTLHQQWVFPISWLIAWRIWNERGQD